MLRFTPWLGLYALLVPLGQGRREGVPSASSPVPHPLTLARDGCALGRVVRVDAQSTRLDEQGRAHVRYRLAGTAPLARTSLRLETSAGGRVLAHTPVHVSAEGGSEGEIVVELAPATSGRFLRFVIESKVTSPGEPLLELSQREELRFDPAPSPRLPAPVHHGGKTTIPVPLAKGGAR